MSETPIRNQAQEPPSKRLLKELEERIDRILEIESKKKRVIEVAREILGKECNVRIDYGTGEVWCWEKIDVDEKSIIRIYQFLKASPPGPWDTRIAINISTSPIKTTQPNNVSEYADEERLRMLFGEKYYGIEYEDHGVYEIYVPIEIHSSDVYAYLVISIERSEDP